MRCDRLRPRWPPADVVLNELKMFFKKKKTPPFLLLDDHISSLPLPPPALFVPPPIAFKRQKVRKIFISRNSIICRLRAENVRRVNRRVNGITMSSAGSLRRIPCGEIEPHRCRSTVFVGRRTTEIICIYFSTSPKPELPRLGCFGLITP